MVLAALASPPWAAAQSDPDYGLLVVAPVEGVAATAVVTALADELGPADAGGTRIARPCAAADGALTPTLLAAVFERAQQSFFLGRFEEAEREIREWLEALAAGCRPLASSPEAWTEPAAYSTLHDLGALLLATARELDRTPAAEATLRRLLAAFPGARPTDGMFPPSLADRYLDLEPDETEVGWVVVDAPGCAANVAGRLTGDRARALAGAVAVGLRCPDEDAFALELTVAPGATVRLTVPTAPASAGASRADRTLLRVAAAAASLAREPLGVAVAEQDGQALLAAWRDPGAGAVLAPVTDPAAVGPWIRGLLSGEPPEDAAADDGLDGWGPLALGVAGAVLGAGGAWALVDARERWDLAASTAAASDHDRLLEEAGTLDAVGWSLVGLGAAALVGTAVWLAVELTTAPETAATGPVVSLVGPGGLGLIVVF
jgi:hypothetical protein